MIPDFDTRMASAAAKQVRDGEQALLAGLLLLPKEHPLRERVNAAVAEASALKELLGYVRSEAVLCEACAEDVEGEVWS